MALENTPGWTYDRMLAELPEGSRYELREGVLLDMSPSPNRFHQSIAGNLYFLFRSFLSIDNKGTAFVAPLDVILNEQEIVQPDILILLGSKTNRPNDRIREIPDLVVEILSPSTFYRDTVEKHELYARHGVKEYWLIDPANRVVEIFTLQDNTYTLHQEMSESGILTSPLLPGFQISYDEVFAA